MEPAGIDGLCSHRSQEALERAESSIPGLALRGNQVLAVGRLHRAVTYLHRLVKHLPTAATIRLYMMF